MAAKHPRFPRAGLEFLRALKRNNRRPWFQKHREEYERFVRAPMVELVWALRKEFARIAPEMVADPAVSLYRIYRDTRFSADKSPYKTHTAAVFPRRGLGKHSGAGFYFHIAPDEVLVAGGIYLPGPGELVALREHIAQNYRELETIVEASAWKKAFGQLEGEKLSRVPRGLPADHPAAEYLKHKQFLAACQFAPEFATSPRFYPTLVDCFGSLLPLIRFLNEPLVRAAQRRRALPERL